MPNPKTHAKDYLEEFLAKGVKIPFWYRELVKIVMRKDGKISDTDIDNIFKILEDSINWIPKEEWETVPIDSQFGDMPTIIQENIVFTEIFHESGVNALMPKQSIPLSRNCTILYGLNGAGKSWYFRVLEDIAGWKGCADEILWNIHNSIPQKKEVLLKYQKEGEEEALEYKWEGRKEDNGYFKNYIRVFDSDYLDWLLSSREAEAWIQPLWIHLFPIISNILDNLKGRLKQKERDFLLQKPSMSLLLQQVHSPSYKLILWKSQFSALEEKELLIDQFTVEEWALLDSKIKERDEFKKQNYVDTRKLLIIERDKLLEISKLIVNKLSNISTYIDKTQKWIELYKIRLENYKQAKEKLSVLRGLPQSDSQEWRNFIEAGSSYSNKCKEYPTILDQKCPYCFQVLSLEAKNILTWYAVFLSQKEKMEFDEVEKGLADLGKLIEAWELKIDIPKFLEWKVLHDWNQLEAKIDSLIKSIIWNISHLKWCIQNKEFTFPEEKLEYSEITEFLWMEERVKSDEITKIDESTKSYADKSAHLDKIIYDLEDKKLLFSQRWDIEKLMSITKKIKKYEEVWKDINTSSITTLSKTASDELLISELEKSLNIELLAFNKKLSVKLDKVHQKWKVYTELKVKWHNAKDVFSEGESKALCLALFITELRYQKTPCVVFDDPVNSLDHEISEKFAARMIELSKTGMQVIVFTHNLLFARQLVSAVNESEIKESCYFHSITKEVHWSWCVSIDHSPRMEDIGKLDQKYKECFKDYDSKSIQEKELSIATWYSLLRSSVESLIEEKILWKVIQRYDSHIKVQSLELIAITEEIIQDTINLHWEISESWDMHLSADIMSVWVNHMEKIRGFRKRFEELCTKVNTAKNERNKSKEVKRKAEKTNPFDNF